MLMRIPSQAVTLTSLCLMLAACAGTYGPTRSDDLFSHVQQGMTMDDVQRVAGAPDERMHYPLSGTDSWAYRYYDTWGFYSEYSVTFGSDGRAIAMISQRIGYGGRSS